MLYIKPPPINTNISIIERDTLKDYVLTNIKHSEGLKLRPYRCPANHWTIGYGHLLTKNDLHIQIDTSFAEALLLYDFNKCYDLTDKTLKHNQRLAIAHFIFNIGFTKYNKSKIPKLIKQNKFIGWELLQFIHYKNNKGVYIKSNNLKKAREFELKLFYL